MSAGKYCGLLSPSDIRFRFGKSPSRLAFIGYVIPPVMGALVTISDIVARRLLSWS
jgi:hypothetical protein